MSSPAPARRAQQAIAMVVLVFVTLTGTPPAPGTTPDRHVRARWAWPVEGPHPIARPFVAPETPFSRGHRGIDIAATAGAIVRSPDDGVIHFSGFVVDRALVSIDHGEGVISSFEPVTSELSEGTRVSRGQEIGVLQSGHCTSPCLHFGVRIHGQYFSPLNFLGGIAHSVLLPTRTIG